MEGQEQEALNSQLTQGLHLEDEETLSLPDLGEVEQILSYTFKDKSLLQQAFTHQSYSEKRCSYERLEYIGDSVINLLFTKHHYFMYPDLPPGSLTPLRSVNVDTEKLARVAIKLSLHRYLRHRKPLLEEKIQEFSDTIREYPLHSHGLVDAPKILADVVESTVGAVYIDTNCSTDTVWEVFEKLLAPIITPNTLRTHPVTELHELCQKNSWTLRTKDSWNEHASFYVFVNDELVGSGTYPPKKDIAHNKAAKDALNKLRGF